MKLIINGDEIEVPKHVLTVQDLLLFYGLEKKMAVVELNQTIVEKAGHGEEILSDGDRVEIVHFVGGG
jgi:sulfur carrier protein